MFRRGLSSPILRSTRDETVVLFEISLTSSTFDPLDNVGGGMPIFYSMKVSRTSNRIPRKIWSKISLVYNFVRSPSLAFSSIESFPDDQSQRMPISVQRSVRKQNIKFLHNRIHFSPEYFHFMKRLVQSNVQVIVNFFQPPPPATQQTEKTPPTNVMLLRLFLSEHVG